MQKVIFLLLILAGIRLQAQEVLVDFNYPEASTSLQNAKSLLQKDSCLYFFAYGKDHVGIWKTDGTGIGTEAILFSDQYIGDIRDFRFFNNERLLVAWNVQTKKIYGLEGNGMKLLNQANEAVVAMVELKQEIYFLATLAKSENNSTTGFYKMSNDLSTSLIKGGLDNDWASSQILFYNQKGFVLQDSSQKLHCYYAEKEILMDLPSRESSYEVQNLALSEDFIFLETRSAFGVDIWKLSISNGKLIQKFTAADNNDKWIGIVTSETKTYGIKGIGTNRILFNLENETDSIFLHSRVLQEIANSVYSYGIIETKFIEIKANQLYFSVLGTYNLIGTYDNFRFGIIDLKSQKVTRSAIKMQLIGLGNWELAREGKFELEGHKFFLKIPKYSSVFSIAQDLKGEIDHATSYELTFPISLQKSTINAISELESPKFLQQEPFYLYEGGEIYHSINSKRKFFGINKAPWQSGYVIKDNLTKESLYQADHGRIDQWEKFAFAPDKTFFSLRTLNSDSKERAMEGIVLDGSSNRTSSLGKFKNSYLSLQSNSNLAWIYFGDGKQGEAFSISANELQTYGDLKAYVYQNQTNTYLYLQEGLQALIELRADGPRIIEDSLSGSIKLFDKCLCYVEEKDAYSVTGLTKFSCNAFERTFTFSTSDFGSIQFNKGRYLSFSLKDKYMVADLLNKGKLVNPMEASAPEASGYKDFIVKGSTIKNYFEVFRNEKIYATFHLENTGDGYLTTFSFFKGILVIGHTNQTFGSLNALHFYDVEAKKLTKLALPSNRSYLNLLDGLPYFYLHHQPLKTGQLFFWNEEKQALDSRETTSSFRNKMNFSFVVLDDIENPKELYFYNDLLVKNEPIELNGEPHYVDNEGAQTSVISQTSNGQFALILTQYLSDRSSKVIARVAAKPWMVIRKVYFEKEEVFASVFTKEAGWQIWKVGKYLAESIDRNLLVLQNEVEEETIQLKVYPIPAKDKVYFDKTVSSVQVLDTQGYILKDVKSLHATEFSISEFPQGLLVLRCTVGNEVYVKKVLKY